MNIINKVAYAIAKASGINDYFKDSIPDEYREEAIAAIEAMRDLVKMTKNGCQTDDIILNKYIDKALSEDVPKS